MRLAFIRCALQTHNAKKEYGQYQSRKNRCAPRGEVVDDDSRATTQCTEKIECEDCATMAKPQIGKPVRRVVLARCCEGQQPAPGTRNRNERRIKNRQAKDQHWSQPRGQMRGILH